MRKKLCIQQLKVTLKKFKLTIKHFKQNVQIKRKTLNILMRSYFKFFLRQKYFKYFCDVVLKIPQTDCSTSKHILKALFYFIQLCTSDCYNLKLHETAVR